MADWVEAIRKNANRLKNIDDIRFRETGHDIAKLIAAVSVTEPPIVEIRRSLEEIAGVFGIMQGAEEQIDFGLLSQELARLYGLADQALAQLQSGEFPKEDA